MATCWGDPGLIRDVHRAPVGELRHQHAGHGLDDLLVIGRSAQQLARTREQLLGELGALQLGDVLDRRHRVEEASVRGIDGLRSDHGPQLLAGGLQRNSNLLSPWQPARSKSLGDQIAVDACPILAPDLQPAQQLLLLGVQKLLRAGEPQPASGGLVRIHQLAARVVHGDRLIKHRHDRVQAALHAFEIREQPRVVQRQPETVGQHLGEVDVVHGVPPLGPGRDQRQRAEVPGAGRHRGDDR